MNKSNDMIERYAGIADDNARASFFGDLPQPIREPFAMIEKTRNKQAGSNATNGYPGSKAASGVAEKIIAIFPLHDLYIEPFVGKSAILRKKQDVCSVVFDVEGLGAYWAAYQHVDFIQKCGIEFLERVFLPPTALVYCDPPYPHSTRSKKNIYRQEWSDPRHSRFLRACRRLACPVVISTYPNDLYESELSGWRSFSFPAMTRGGVRTEQIYCNYDFDDAAGSNDFLGVDFRDRWRLKKKLRRQLARFAALPAAERIYLLRHLHDRYAPELALRSAPSALALPARGAISSAARVTPKPARHPRSEKDIAAPATALVDENRSEKNV